MRLSVVVEENAGDAVRTIMDLEKMNQSKLAETMKCNRQAVQQALTRRSGNMRVTTLLRMVRAMGWEIVLTKCTKTEE